MPPSPFSALPPRHSITTLPLKIFRGERDITEFDWPFTPYHSSSARFSTQVGSVLHSILLELQPGHGKITRFRVYRMLLNALFRLGFPTAPAFGLNLATYE